MRDTIQPIHAEPLVNEILRKASRPWVCQHAIDLVLQNVWFAELVLFRELQQFFVRDAGPEKERESAGKFQVTDFDGETPDFQVIIPDFGTVAGPFQVTSIEYAGSHNGEATYEVSLASAGALQFVPVPVT